MILILKKNLEKRGQKSMKILFDTNIMLDVLLKRKPHNKAAQVIWTKCADREGTGYLAAHSIPNSFYVLRKEYSQEERRKFIRNLCEIFRISDLSAEKIIPVIDLMRPVMGINWCSFVARWRCAYRKRLRMFSIR